MKIIELNLIQSEDNFLCESHVTIKKNNYKHMKQDIKTREDLLKLITIFYDKLLQDESIKHHFVDIKDLKSHIELIVDFWTTLLLGSQIYKNNTVQAHRHLPLKKEEFAIWTRHFDASVNELFSGEKADEAISRANTIALTMRYKLLGS